MHIYDEPQWMSRDHCSHNPHVLLFLLLLSASVLKELAFTKPAFKKKAMRAPNAAVTIPG